MKFIPACRRDAPPCGGASLDQMIPPDNEVRLIDAFVDSLALEKLGFRTDFPENGRPAYPPATLLKLLVYGYLNRIRSSRCLERECHRNLEVMWLLGQLAPDHYTIANFHKSNSKAITHVFRATVRMAQHFELIGGKLLAGDSTKLRAQNSKKNNYNRAKITRHLLYIEQKLSDYIQALAQPQSPAETERISESMARHARRREYYIQARRREYYLQLLQQLLLKNKHIVAVSLNFLPIPLKAVLTLG